MWKEQRTKMSGRTRTDRFQQLLPRLKCSNMYKPPEVHVALHIHIFQKQQCNSVSPPYSQVLSSRVQSIHELVNVFQFLICNPLTFRFRKFASPQNPTLASQPPSCTDVDTAQHCILSTLSLSTPRGQQQFDTKMTFRKRFANYNINVFIVVYSHCLVTWLFFMLGQEQWCSMNMLGQVRQTIIPLATMACYRNRKQATYWTISNCPQMASVSWLKSDITVSYANISFELASNTVPN